MSKTTKKHEQVFTCGAACAMIDGSLHTETSVDKLVAAMKSLAKKHA